MSIEEFFDKFDDGCSPIKNVEFEWSAKGCGFGRMNFYIGDDGYVHCGNEIMGREFLKKMLCLMVDNCVLDEPGQWDEVAEGKPPGYDPNKNRKSTNS